MQTTGLILQAEADFAKIAREKSSPDEAREMLSTALNPIYVDEVN